MGLLGELDLHLVAEGRHWQLWRCLGAHLQEHEGSGGVRFAVWAPNASAVSVAGDFNGWNPQAHRLECRPEAGVWEGFVAGAKAGDRYKFAITDHHGSTRLKGDPLARWCERPPATASRVAPESGFAWTDGLWMAGRAERCAPERPISIYEVHAGSWSRHPDGRAPDFDDLMEWLIPYVCWLGFTHIELLPVSEHPYGGSWGYQPTALFAPTARLGPPDALRRFVDRCHAAGLGVILDWVPAHFPTDAHGLAQFDGTCLYEHADPRQGHHPDWGTLIYNYGRHEVANFLIANALYWLEEFHIDGLRVDAVASMLYLDYGRAPGQWIPNEYGGHENLAAAAFLRQLNDTVHARVPGAITFAEESTAWAGVTRDTGSGGLGFDYKWNLGWMNDTLAYFRRDPVHRYWHHHQIGFGFSYAFDERFVLPLSHDEVVHGKGSLRSKMPGDAWQGFANLRLLLALQFSHPGKKLLFMGGEFGQWQEWREAGSLQWSLIEHPDPPEHLHWHRGLRQLVVDLNGLYRSEPALHRGDCHSWGFEWIDGTDAANNVFAWIRRGDPDPGSAIRSLVVVVNASPVPRMHYRIGVPERPGLAVDAAWSELLNTDAKAYGGSGLGNLGAARPEALAWQGRPRSIVLTLPPLAALVLAG